MLKKHDNDDFLTAGPYKSRSSDPNHHLFPIDETEEFYDPFSDLSLFLARKIKYEISKGVSPKKWSRNIQINLLKNILPDFHKRFPKYRLGHTALKKTWDKVLYYLQFIQKQQESITESGKLNVDFLIRQNLKNILHHPLSSDLHPYTTAHNLAVKISECVATIDGERIQLEELTKTIWAIQKHLIPKSSTPSPFERYDGLDKLIVRFQLEEIAKNPTSTQKQIAETVSKKVESIKQLDRIRNADDITTFCSFLLAEKLYPSLSLHTKYSSEKLQDLTLFIRKQILVEKEAGFLKESKDCLHIVQKILFLYQLASHLSLDETKHNLENAFHYVSDLSQNKLPQNLPVLRKEVYALIDAELAHLKEKKVEHPLDHLLSTLMRSFMEAKELPKLDGTLHQELEILVWKVLQEEYPAFEKYPLHLKESLCNELGNICIDHPKESFQKLLFISLSCLKKLQTLDISLLDKKIHFWSLQNDMPCKFLHFGEETPIIKLISRVAKQEENQTLSHNDFVQKVLSLYLKNNASLLPFRALLELRITILYKHFWYNTLAKEKETSYERFLHWHLRELFTKTEKEFPEVLLTRLEEITKNLIPLAPFSQRHARLLLPQ